MGVDNEGEEGRSRMRSDNEGEEGRRGGERGGVKWGQTMKGEKGSNGVRNRLFLRIKMKSVFHETCLLESTYRLAKLRLSSLKLIG